MEQFSLQIVTPDGVGFSGEAERLIVRTIEETGILMERLNDMMHRS